MQSYNEFKLYEKEIWELIEEINDFNNDREYVGKIINKINEKIENIRSLDLESLSDKKLDTINSFIEYVNDVLKEMENKNSEALEQEK